MLFLIPTSYMHVAASAEQLEELCQIITVNLSHPIMQYSTKFFKIPDSSFQIPVLDSRF